MGLLSAWVKICQIPRVNFESTSQFLFNFLSFFSVSTHKSSVNFYPMHFLLWTKGSRQSANSDTFKCSGENLSNSSCHFPNHKSVFLQILHHSSVSWDVITSELFSWNVMYFQQKESIKVRIWWNFMKVWNFALWWAPFVHIMVIFSQKNTSVICHNNGEWCKV